MTFTASNFKGQEMARNILILFGFISLLGFTVPAHADHGHHRYVQKHYHGGYGHRVNHRFRGHPRQFRPRVRHHRGYHYRPRVRRHYYYDARPYRYRHRVDPIVAGLVVGTLVYTLSGH